MLYASVCCALFKVFWDVCLHLAPYYTYRFPCFSVAQMSGQKAIQGSETEMRELLVGSEESIVSLARFIELPFRQINYFFTYLTPLIFDWFTLPDLSDCICSASTGLFSNQNLKKFRRLKPYFVFVFFRACILKVLMGMTPTVRNAL